jgi:Kef-type K+ transport system membrane component KefB/CBS domain-containing protein
LFRTLVPISLALLLSLWLGRLAGRVGIPRVTVYLLVGLVLGPHAGLRLFEPDGLAQRLLLGPATELPLEAMEQLAIGFILFGVGAEFQIPTFRREGPRLLAVSAAEVALTAVLVALAVQIGTGDWRLATVAPALAVASAPSATLVTLREVEAEGPTTRCLLLAVGLNNLMALLAFPLLLALAFGGGDPGGATAVSLVVIAAGAVLGLAAAVGLESVTGRRDVVLLGLLVVLAALGLAHAVRPGALGLGMLACFAAGMAVANGSPHAPALFRYLENTVYPLYVLFFISAGRNLHVEALAGAGVLGVLFVGARALGKVAGARMGVRLAGWEHRLPGGLGAGLLCQAGIALGLVSALEAAAPEATTGLRHVVVASVVVFELVGPWLLRRTVVGAGEVTFANVRPHAEASSLDAAKWVWIELRRRLGLVGGDVLAPERSPTVRHAMRRRPPVIAEDLPFDRVLKELGEGGAELLPVLDREGRLKGVISYDQVKNTLYDPVLRGLVIAEDLSLPVEDALAPDDSLAQALEAMDRHRVHSWPVVEDGRLLGMVRRADVYVLMRGGLRRGARPEASPRANSA